MILNASLDMAQLMANKKYPLIEVEWDDHWIENEDISIEDAKKGTKPIVGKYAGYLIHETKQMLVIASNIWEETQEVGPTMYIMKRSITYRSDK